jgi:hypothetical protein
VSDIRRTGQLVLLALCVLAIDLGLVGIGLTLQSPRTTPSAVVVSTPSPSATATASPTSRCHSANGLPDPICTPGLADLRVTQANIHTTICVSGYTSKVRPSARYTNALKAEQIKAYGYSDTKADYEEDHLIPLELGGHPTDQRNLWPEPRTGAHPAAAKDRLENALHTKVCTAVMTLAAAQAAIAINWESP